MEENVCVWQEGPICEWSFLMSYRFCLHCLRLSTVAETSMHPLDYQSKSTPHHTTTSPPPPMFIFCTYFTPLVLSLLLNLENEVVQWEDNHSMCSPLNPVNIKLVYFPRTCKQVLFLFIARTEQFHMHLTVLLHLFWRSDFFFFIRIKIWKSDAGCNQLPVLSMA